MKVGSVIGRILACLIVVLSASCFAADVDVTILAKNPSSSDEWSGATTLITLSGTIVEGDGDKFLTTIKKYLKQSYYSDSRGNIVLQLLDSDGGNLPEALRIAEVVRKERITTFVPKKSKCISACAMIFLAGRRSIYEMGEWTERILEIGGTLGFHGPYEENDLDQRGMMVEGVSIVRRMMFVLGDALPNELLIETSTLPPGERKIVDSVYDALRWNIQLVGYKKPAPGRESLLNACINDAQWKHVRPLGQIEGVDQDKQIRSFLEDKNETPIFDKRKMAIRANNYVLPKEGDSGVATRRKTEKTPDLLRDRRRKDGTYASQFAFGYEDESSAFWCSAVHRPNREEVEIYPRRLSIVALLQGKDQGRSGLPDTVPDWFQYPPGTKLSQIAK